MKKTKIGYIILTFLEILLVLGAFVIQYFTNKKMGMLRFVVYKNMVWEERFAIELWKTFGVIFLLGMALLVCICLAKKYKNTQLYVKLMVGVMLILTAFSVGFTMTNSVDTVKAYYFMAPMIGTGALLQTIKTGLAICSCKTKKDVF